MIIENSELDQDPQSKMTVKICKRKIGNHKKRYWVDIGLKIKGFRYEVQLKAGTLKEELVKRRKITTISLQGPE